MFRCCKDKTKIRNLQIFSRFFAQIQRSVRNVNILDAGFQRSVRNVNILDAGFQRSVRNVEILHRGRYHPNPCGHLFTNEQDGRHCVELSDDLTLLDLVLFARNHVLVSAIWQSGSDAKYL